MATTAQTLIDFKVISGVVDDLTSPRNTAKRTYDLSYADGTGQNQIDLIHHGELLDETGTHTIQLDNFTDIWGTAGRAFDKLCYVFFFNSGLGSILIRGSPVKRLPWAVGTALQRFILFSGSYFATDNPLRGWDILSSTNQIIIAITGTSSLRYILMGVSA